jgi:enediyne polyketide synthase
MSEELEGPLMREGIAIVGMACRYADARTPTELWENVLARRRAFRRVPAERLRLEDYLSDDPSSSDSLYLSEAAVIEGWEFDRVRFRVAGGTFRTADLAHWLALDIASQALADAGFPDGEGLERDAAGVLLGNSLTGEFSRANLLRLRWPYVRRVLAASLAEEGWEPERAAEFLRRLEPRYKAPFPANTEESLAGGLSNTIAGRICNHFDLHGGGYTVDGACASSLLAVANACSALAAGDLDVALAGGVDLSLDPFELVGFARTGALAPEEMRVFDARSAGFLPGEGCGFVVLMRESDAVRQGCRVHAVLRGWGISSDGHGGISRPEAEGQKMALARAYRRAGFGIDSIGYFEGHGTGTAVGDATELTALSQARREAPDAPPAPVGSVKANIGHTKAAAGVAGLIKAAMALQSQLLPPNTGCDEPHPLLASGDSPLRVLDRGEVWPADRPLRAGVSAMGFGGINAHLVLDAEASSRRRSLSVRERTLLSSSQDAEVLLLAAPDAAALTDQVQRLLDIARRLSRAELADLAAELHRRLEPGPARAAVVAANPKELAPRLERLLGWLRDGETSRLEPRHGAFLGIGAQPRRIGFLFPGQGSPAHLDGGALRRRFDWIEPVYETAHLPAGADGIDTAVAQPAILTGSLAGLAALERLGLRAAVGAGHSLGEIAALCWAGALDAESAVRLAAARGRAMADLPGPTGTMASLGATPEEVEPLLSSRVGIAAFNAPRRTVISGEAAAVETVCDRAREHGVAVTRLRVSHAFHSPLVEAAAPRLAEALAATALRRPARPVASTVTGALLSPEADLRELLLAQVTRPVRFTEALAAARGLADLWIEVGPGHALTDLAGETLDRPVLPLDAGGPSLSGLLKAAGAAFALGVPVDPAALFEGRFTRPFDLEREPLFLANPCEMAPVDGLPLPVVVDLPVAAAAVATAAIEPIAPITGGPLEIVRGLVAERAELPPAAVSEDNRLLGDLHLNSISVGQIVVEAARRMGLRPPASPTDFAHATVAEVAHALEEMARLAPAALAAPDGEAVDQAVPPGVDSWVRAFTVEWVPRALPRHRAHETGDGWQVIAPPEHPLAASLGLAGSGVALCLPPEPGEEHVPLFLEAARAVLEAPRPARFLLVQQGGGGGGFARTLHLEMPDVAVRVVDLPLDHPEAAAWAAAEAMAGTDGYVEARYDASGERRVPVLRLLPELAPIEPLSLGPEDVLLVSGGGKGITAESALAISQATGARLALLGRSLPEADAELAANLERMSAAGARVLYVPADVADPGAVRAAVSRVEAELGPVTALLHGAGANRPRLLGSLDEEDFRRTLAPKVRGFANLLAALDPGRLRLVVSFGSIIARTGLKGEADYATANEWLRLATERLGREHPGCRCLTLDWSVWSGVGMGERLGTLENLIREGITPIPPDIGLAMLRGLLVRPLPASSLVVAGRFGEPPTLEVERPELPLRRFLEKPRAFYPGVELVADSGISADTDPYLADHVFRGEPLFAAVLGLEAMAQAAMAVLGTGELPVFEEVELLRPVAVPPGRATTVRVAALVREPGRVEVALRDGSTGFAADHFRAVCRFAGPARAADPGLLVLSEADGHLPIRTEGDLYGGILFHRGRFQRLGGYRRLNATECLAEIVPDGHTAWFGGYLPPELVLGDPGARDAAIHGIQACIPHSTLLPVGVDRIVAGRIAPEAPLVLAARERFRDGSTFVYDMEIRGADGHLYERWEGLRLRAVDRVTPPSSWSSALLAPYVERRLQELIPGSGIQVAVESNGRAVARRHRPDGKPETSGSNGDHLSLAHAGSLVLTVAGQGRIGCDFEAVAPRGEEMWRGLLGQERFGLAELIVRERGETPDAAATRVWAAAESLKKAGVPHGAPLTLDATDAAGAAGDDGWLLMRSGDLVIGTFLGPVQELSGPAALAVLVEGGRAGL